MRARGTEPRLPLMARRSNETAKAKHDTPELTVSALSIRFPLISGNSSDLGNGLVGLKSIEAYWSDDLTPAHGVEFGWLITRVGKENGGAHVILMGFNARELCRQIPTAASIP